MIRFLKEVYLTGFAIMYRIPRTKDIAYKAGGATVAITVVEWFVLEGLRGYIGIYLNKKIIISEPIVLIAYFALFLVNGYFLFFLKHGIKFAHEFDSLKKSRRILLVVSFAVLSVAAIVFGICATIAHRRFIGID